MSNQIRKAEIFNSMLRRASELRTYMNAYSMTIRNYMSNEDFADLYDKLAEVTDKYETIPV